MTAMGSLNHVEYNHNDDYDSEHLVKYSFISFQMHVEYLYYFDCLNTRGNWFFFCTELKGKRVFLKAFKFQITFDNIVKEQNLLFNFKILVEFQVLFLVWF